MATKPWDSRIARRIVLPLAGTRVHPNHITTLGLVVGIGAALLYAQGERGAANLGALLYVLAGILDHADGELARLTGTTSSFGRAYDRMSDLVVKFCVFGAMGLGFRHGALGAAGPICGLSAGVAFVAIFGLRGGIARRRGWDALDQPKAAGFELEDVLYVVAPLTWLGMLAPFLVAAAVGAPLFALWVLRSYLRARIETTAPEHLVLDSDDARE